jgi:hypothetical protein
MDLTAILTSFLIPQMNMHLMHSLRVASCAAFLTSFLYFVLSFLSSPYHAVLQLSKNSFELSFCLCCKASINLNFCVSLTTLVKRSRRSGCRSFQLAADWGLSSWRKRAQLSACSRSAFMTIVTVFSLPNFWTWSSLETWRHHVLMSRVSLSLPRNLFGLCHVDTGVIVIVAILLS